MSYTIINKYHKKIYSRGFKNYEEANAYLNKNLDTDGIPLSNAHVAILTESEREFLETEYLFTVTKSQASCLKNLQVAVNTGMWQLAHQYLEELFMVSSHGKHIFILLTPAIYLETNSLEAETFGRALQHYLQKNRGHHKIKEFIAEYYEDKNRRISGA